MTRWIAALAAGVLLLTGCGSDTTPEGLAAALDEDGIGLDPGTSPQRYYDAVQGVCDSNDLARTASSFITAAEAGNTDALDRMLVGMGYMCPKRGEDLGLLVEAG